MTSTPASTSDPRGAGYAFGPFVLDERDHTLTRAGEAIPLAPKAFELLIVLVRHAGRPLNKDELMEQVWPDIFVEEANLAVHISMLRKTLGERSGGGQYIETLPRRGYRFAADVRECDPEFERTPPPTNSTLAGADMHSVSPVARLRSRHLKLVAILTAIIVAVAGALAVRFISKPAAGGTKSFQKLAVLPFANSNPDGSSPDLGFALADSVINKLGAVGALVVRPTTYVEKYRNINVIPIEAARELDVDFLLMGTYLAGGDEVTVNAQLIDVEHDAKLWSESIKLKSDKMTELQDYVARQVVKGLRVQLSAREDARIDRNVSVDPRAYASFVEARYLMSSKDHPEAVRLLEEAVRIDPNFALGWTYLARAYHISALQFSGDRKELLKAEADYQQSLALDPEEPQTRLMFAKLLTETGRVEESATRLVALLQDNPNFAEAHWELSYAYRYAGLILESIAEGERALDLDRRLQSHQFNSYLYAGRYEKFLDSLPIEETAYVTFYRGLSYTYLNDPQRAAAAFDRAYELNPGSVIAQIGKALRLAGDGKKREAHALLQAAETKLAQVGTGDGEIAYKFAQGYDAAGDSEAALRALDRSIDEGFYCYPYFAADPLLKSVRATKSFPAILDRARLRHEAFARKISEIGSTPGQH